MYRNPRILFILVTFVAGMSACVNVPSTTTAGSAQDLMEGVDATLGTLVTAEWLSSHLDDPDLVVLDCRVQVEPDGQGGYRSVSGRPGYEGGHIPSAGFADLVSELRDPDSPYQFAMPSAERFSAVMSALGVGDTSRVVLYDDSHSVWAARVWWMLRSFGFDRAAVLDGGLRAWTAQGQALSTEPVSRHAQSFTAVPRPELIADRAEVLAAIGNGSVRLIDAMPAAHFRGEMTMYARPGHIPGASSVPAYSLVDETGHYKANEKLAALLNGDVEARTITYCGGGIAASSNAFVLHRLGYSDVAVYIHSLQEWAADPENPMIDETP